MGTTALPRSTRRSWRVAAVGLLASISVVVDAGVVWTGGRVPPLVAGLAATTLLALGDVGLVLAAVRASEHRPIKWRRPRRLGLHAAAAVATSVFVAVTEAGAHALVPWVGAAFVPAAAFRHLSGYAVVLVLTHALVLARRLGRARTARVHLDQSLARAGRARAAAELRAAKAELHPMLVTGALATARGLVRDDPDAAERVVIGLGALMREAVAAADVEEVTLDEELEAALERAGASGEAGPLTVDVDPPERELLVPHLVLPALVACAVDVGADPRALTVRAHRVSAHAGSGDQGERLVLAVIGRPDPRRPRRGTVAAGPVAAASASVHALGRRLHPLYGDAAQLTTHAVGECGPGGPGVRLVLPARSDDTPAQQPSGAAEISRTPNGYRDQGAHQAAHEAVAVGDDAPEGPRGADAWHADAWAAVALVAVWTAIYWCSLATAHGGRWAAAPVLLMAGVYGASLAGVAAAAVVTTRRRPVGADDRIGAAVRSHVAAATLAASIATLSRLAAGWTAFGLGLAVWKPLTPGTLVLRILAMVAVYLPFAGVAHAVALGGARRRGAQTASRLRAVRAARTRDRVASELRALKAELNPHFVGNALHTAAALVRRDPDGAVYLLGTLGTLAGAAGAHVDTQEVALADEVLGLEPFLALEQARLGAFGGRLAVTWHVAPDVLDAAVPHLVLQPLAENAVRHGLAPRGGTGRLVVGARRVGGRVELTVTDDGGGLSPRRADGAPAWATRARATSGAVSGHIGGAMIEAVPRAATGVPAAGVTGGLGTGAGLSGVRRRLALLYGAEASCVLEGAPGGGTVARLTFPYRRAVAAGETTELQIAAGG